MDTEAQSHQCKYSQYMSTVRQSESWKAKQKLPLPKQGQPGNRNGTNKRCVTVRQRMTDSKAAQSTIFKVKTVNDKQINFSA